MQLSYELLPDEYAITRRAPDSAPPDWTAGDGFCVVARSAGELSIVCPARCVPPGEQTVPDWRALRLVGPFDLSLTGVLLAVLAPLAEARVPIFAVSTFDTDYVLIPAGSLDVARAALRQAGHCDVTAS